MVLCDNCQPCTCSTLSNKTDHRCLRHPDNRALTPDERFDFEHKFDAHIARSLADGKAT